MSTQFAPKELCRRPASEVPIVKALTVMWKDNYWPRRSSGVGGCGVWSRALGPNKLIGDPRLSDVENRGIAGLGVIKNEVRRRDRSISFIIKIVCINEWYKPRGE